MTSAIGPVEGVATPASFAQPTAGRSGAGYRGTSLIINSGRLGTYSRNMPRALWQSYGGRQFLMSEVPLHGRGGREGRGVVEGQGSSQPRVELRANLKSIPHRRNLLEVACAWELTPKMIGLPLGCLQGGDAREKLISERRVLLRGCLQGCYLTECIYLFFVESQLPHKIVNLLFTIPI